MWILTEWMPTAISPGIFRKKGVNKACQEIHQKHYKLSKSANSNFEFGLNNPLEAKYLQGVIIK